MNKEFIILYIICPFLLFFIIPMTVLKKKTKKSKYIIIFFVFMYILSVGFRDSGGADDFNYRLYYENNYGGKEPLFSIVCLIGKALNLNYKWLFLCYAIITASFIGIGLKNYIEQCNEKTKNDTLLFYIAGFYFIVLSSTLTTMRQAVSMAILFYLYSIKDIKLIRKIFIWILIICTHYGFILLIPIEIFFHVKKYKLSPYTMAIVPIVCIIFSKINLQNIILKITSTIGMYEYLNTSENYGYSSEMGVVGITLLIMFLYKMLKYKKSIKANCLDIDTLNRISCGQMMYLSMMFLTINMRWSNRIGYYYFMFMPFLIDDFCFLLPFNTKSKNIIRLCVLFITYIFAMYVLYNLFQGTNCQWSINLK